MDQHYFGKHRGSMFGKNNMDSPPIAKNLRLRNASMMDSQTKSGFATLNDSDGDM